MRRVLVVDDDPDVCELIRDMLQEVRLDAICVNDDQAAYRLIPTLPSIQALVVDVNLGTKTTGFDVARFARQVIPSLPVIYVTGAASREAFSTFGVPDSDYLQKPFQVDDLLAKLAGRIARAPSGATTARP